MKADRFRIKPAPLMKKALARRTRSGCPLRRREPGVRSGVNKGRRRSARPSAGRRPGAPGAIVSAQTTSRGRSKPERKSPTAAWKALFCMAQKSTIMGFTSMRGFADTSGSCGRRKLSGMVWRRCGVSRSMLSWSGREKKPETRIRHEHHSSKESGAFSRRASGHVVWMRKG